MGRAQVCSGVGRTRVEPYEGFRDSNRSLGSGLCGKPDVKLLCTRQVVRDSSANGSRQRV